MIVWHIFSRCQTIILATSLWSIILCSRYCSIISFRFNDDWNMLTSWCECFGRQKRNGKRYDDIHSCPLFHMENCELLNYHIWLLGVVMSCLHHCCVRSVTDSFINSIDWFVVLSHFNLEIHCFHSFFLTSTHFRLFSKVSTVQFFW